MNEPEPQADAVQAASYQSLAMLRERIDHQEKQIEQLWRRIHSLSEMLEDRDVH